MSAPLNPNQLKMFMSPREVGAEVDRFEDIGPNTGGMLHEHPDAKWKRDGNEKYGLGKSVAAEGVHNPIRIGHGTVSSGRPNEVSLQNGHHRVIAQGDADPDRLMPVIHHGWEDRGDAFRTWK